MLFFSVQQNFLADPTSFIIYAAFVAEIFDIYCKNEKVAKIVIKSLDDFVTLATSPKDWKWDRKW